MNRRNFIVTVPALAACGRRRGGNSIEGRWEGKLTNGASSLTVNFDFAPKPGNQMEFRFQARDLFLVTHPIETWKLEGSRFEFSLPLIEGPRTYTGSHGGPTIDVTCKPAEEQIHLRRLGRIPSPPYQESSLTDLTPTQRSVRSRAQIVGDNRTLAHFNADLLARLGIATSSKPAPQSGIVFVQDMDIPAASKAGMPEFAVFLGPAHERIENILTYKCPILVLLGEADSRNTNLERGSRQIAYDLRESASRQKRTDVQIKVIPKADQTLRVPGYGREYPRLHALHIDFFRQFLSKFLSPGGAPV